jgi:putative hydrolase
VYSHGKGDIEDNWLAAKAAGLETLGIADHGPGHIGFGLDPKKIPEMMQKARAMNLRASKEGGPQVKIGVEANIIDPDGQLDMSTEDLEQLDFVIAGYHFGTIGRAPLKAGLMHASGFVYSHTRLSSARQRDYNTMLVVKALENNKIDILSHPGAKADFDIEAIARACERYGTLMEINNRHGCLTVEGIRQAAKYDVRFSIGSDAHVPQDVGRCDEALARAVEAGLDLSRIVNLRRE